MQSIMNHKLYNTYFPISSEDEKQKFLSEEKDDLIKGLRGALCDSQTDYFYVQRNYYERMRNTVSLLGNINFRNVLHNKKIEAEMEADSRIRGIKNKIEDYDTLLDTLIMQGDVSVDEINRALEYINANKKRVIKEFLFCTGIMVVLAFTVVLLVVFKVKML